MTDEELTEKLRLEHGCCPRCGSDRLDASDYDGATTLTHKTECACCWSVWYEHYNRPVRQVSN